MSPSSSNGDRAERRSEPRNPDSVASKIAFIRRNIRTIRAEIEAGSKIDPKILEELEMQLDEFEQRNASQNGHFR